jgi:hypothetical protein
VSLGPFVTSGSVFVFTSEKTRIPGTRGTKEAIWTIFLNAKSSKKKQQPDKSLQILSRLPVVSGTQESANPRSHPGAQYADHAKKSVITNWPRTHGRRDSTPTLHSAHLLPHLLFSSPNKLGGGAVECFGEGS